MQLYDRQFTADFDLPETDAPVRPYLIATTPRCGSHFLGHMLWSTGDCGVPLEYLNPANLAEWKRLTGTTDIPDCFAALFQRRTSSNGRFGVKAHWPHLRALGRGEEVQDILPFDRAILIYRRNRLAQAVSYAIAKQTGQWISEMDPETTPSYSYATILDHAVKLRRQNDAWKRFFRGRMGSMSEQITTSPRLSIAYEDFLADRAAIFGQIYSLITDAPFDPGRLPDDQTEKQRSSLNREWQDRFRTEVTTGDEWVLTDQPDPLA